MVQLHHIRNAREPLLRTSQTLMSSDIFWKTRVAPPGETRALRLQLLRTLQGLTQAVLTLNPDQTQVVALGGGAGEVLYGTTDLLNLPAGEASLFGNISISRWPAGARYQIQGSLWKMDSVGYWEQEGDTVVWDLPDPQSLSPEAPRGIRPHTPFARLLVTLL